MSFQLTSRKTKPKPASFFRKPQRHDGVGEHVFTQSKNAGRRTVDDLGVGLNLIRCCHPYFHQFSEANLGR